MHTLSRFITGSWNTEDAPPTVQEATPPEATPVSPIQEVTSVLLACALASMPYLATAVIPCELLDYYAVNLITAGACTPCELCGVNGVCVVCTCL